MKWKIRSMEDVVKYHRYLIKKGVKNWTKDDLKLWDIINRLIMIDNFVKGRTKKGSHMGTKVKESIIEW